MKKPQRLTAALIPLWTLAAVLSLGGCDSTGINGTSPITVGGGGSGGTGGTSNAAPVALADIAVVQVNSTNNPVNVLANDSDSNGDSLSITAVSLTLSMPNTAGGTVAIAPDSKTLRYTPPASFVGTQTLSYTISDGKGGVATALVVVTVSPLALPPAALPDTFSKLVDAPVSMLDVLANDIDGAGGGLVITQASSVATIPADNAGTVSVVNGALQYQPKPGFNGVETLSYTLRDANGATATAVVVAVVLPLVPPPVALPDLNVLGMGTSSDIDVLSNDVDLAGGGLTLTGVSPLASLPSGSEGVFSIVANRVRYVPISSSFVGTQSASYTVTDQNGSTATALLSIVVSPALPAVPPLALPDVVTLSSGNTAAALDVLGNDIDFAGGGLAITAAEVMLGLPGSAGVSVATDGLKLQLTLSSTFAGVLTLSYTITDANGSVATTAVVVTVAPAALPTVPPVPVPDLISLAQDSAATAINVLANDIDPAAGGLTVTAASVLASLPIATHTVAVVGNQVEFTPAALFAGVATVSYTVTDSNGSSADGLLTITVVPASPIALPAAVGDVGGLVVTLLGGSTGSFDVLANDIDPAAAGLTLQSVSFTNPLLTTVGSLLTIVGNQVELTVPLLGVITGVLPIEYTAVDSLGRTVTGLLNVTISL